MCDDRALPLVDEDEECLLTQDPQQHEPLPWSPPGVCTKLEHWEPLDRGEQPSLLPFVNQVICDTRLKPKHVIQWLKTSLTAIKTVVRTCDNI